MCTTNAIELSDFLVANAEGSGEAAGAQVPADAEVDYNSKDIFSIKMQNALPELQDVIQRYIEFAVQRNGGAKDRTAKEIGIDRKTLYKKIKNSELLVH